VARIGSLSNSPSWFNDCITLWLTLEVPPKHSNSVVVFVLEINKNSSASSLVAGSDAITYSSSSDNDNWFSSSDNDDRFFSSDNDNSFSSS